MTTDFTDIAIKYAEAGVKIFPCDPKSRKPLCRNGFKSATTDKKAIRRWWKANPAALIGGVCDDQFLVIDCDLKNGGRAFESLGKIHAYTKKAGASVTTMSNGCHYYFKYDETIRRRIKVLDSVDILGKGGYVVLPDGVRYTQTGDLDSFVQSIQNLPDVDSDFADHLRGVFEIPALTKVREAVEPVKKKSENQKKEMSKDEFRDEVADAIEAASLASHNKMYEKIGKNAGFRRIEYNGEPIKLEVNTMTTQTFNSIFHNKEVQKRIATYMGVPIPKEETGKGVSFRSILPSHKDDNPSMAARWTEREDGGSTLIVRDFSDHYKNNREDYNLTRLFMVQKYGKNYRRPSPTEFYVWSIRLLNDAGVVNFRVPEFTGVTKNLTEGQRKAAEGFLKLVGVKSLWKGGTTETCYSQKFASAWTGVSTETVNKMKAKAIKFGIIEKSGKYHGDGAMRTPIFSLGKGAVLIKEIRNISEMILAVNNELKRKKEKTGISSRFFEKRTESSSENTTQVEEAPKKGDPGWLKYELKRRYKNKAQALNKNHNIKREIKNAPE